MQEFIELPENEIINAKYYYSASENMFIVMGESESLDLIGVIEVTIDAYNEMNFLPASQMLASDANGAPISVPVGTYYYSAIDNAFYPYAMQSIYLKAGTWPKNGKPVDESTYYEFAVNEPPIGKQRIAAKNGLPVWSDIPEPSYEQLVADAEQQKQALLSAATNVIAPLQDSIDLGMETKEEAETLKNWKTYRVLLNRVDTSTAPDINWPQKPE